ncbi:MAG: stage III sporulation protein AE [Oscillospiraceae bacterium]|nr:stage III sporulation protein AE [Oscillospiraceae bacterium]
MKKFIISLLLLYAVAMPAKAVEITAPAAPEEAQDLMPVEQSSFGEDLWYVVKSAVQRLQPELVAGCGVCLAVTASVLLTSMLGSFPGSSKSTTELVGCVAIACLVLGTTNSLIGSAADTVRQLSDYGKLLLPVMTTATAAQGAVTTSTAIYVGTALFDALLGSLIASVLTPLIYMFIALSIAKSALNEPLLKKLQSLVKWVTTWSLKIILYIFTGYITITGVVSGTADQSALKATKLTISGMVPVVGGILSDASEAILVGASAVKNTIGVYGLVAVLAIAIGPFLKIGLQYLLLKLIGAVCGIFGGKQTTGLIDDMAAAMGLLLAMTGAVCLLLLISIVCFMKGVS